MQNGTSVLELGTQREFVCVWCTGAYGSRKLRQHVYGEYRSRHEVERFWECVACGHQRAVSILDEIDGSTDAETERLHDQWRKDNPRRHQ